MTEDDDAFDFDGADLTVDGDPVGKITDFDVSVERSVEDFDPDDVANTAIASHGDKIMAAVESAVWHTLIDGAGHEVFPHDYAPTYMREVIHRLESEGFAKTDGTAFYAGVQAYDAIVDDERFEEITGTDGLAEPVRFDGFEVFESKHAPEGVIIFVDPSALYRVPPEVITRSLGLDSAATVSSPIGVRDSAGVAVVNIDVSGSE